MKPADLSILPVSVKPEDEAAYRAKVAHMTGINLPVIIDAPGEYITRSGLAVTIYRIDPPDLATFNCKGDIKHPKKAGRGIRYEYQVWQPNGRNMGLCESQRDIVGKAQVAP